jgi:Immunoglobulin domain/Secretion system C-terminal sorting domain/Immunoglobulin I-set domain
LGERNRGSGTDEVANLSVDASGNLLLAGYVQTNGANIEVYSSGAGRPNLGNFGAYSGSFEAALIKLGSSGSFSSSDAYLFGSTAGAEKFRSMTLDASGNIYLSGELFNTVDFDPSGGTSNVTESAPQGAGDAFIVKYSSAMALQWAGNLKGGGVEYINGLGTDASGNLYAVGSFQSFENFDLFAGTHTKTAVGSSDAFFAKYNGSNGSFNYVQQIGGSSGDNSVNGVYVNSAGDFYMTGFFSGASANFNPAGAMLTLSPTGTTDAFLAKYNSSGTNTWAFKSGGTGKNGGYAINIASDGKIIWGGYYSGSVVDFDPGVGSGAQTSAGNEDMFIASYTECAGAAITTQPAASQSICTGQNAAFTVVATGTGLTYQWKKGGIALSNGGSVSGSTTAALNITGLVVGDAATYTVDVIGCTGTVVSSNSVLTVPSGAAITVQPTATQTLCVGTPASITVTATGTGLTYQWKKGGSNVTNGGTISGATTATLTISSLVAGDAANYTVDVTATGCGSPLSSSTSVLNVNPAAAITMQPVTTQTLCVGAPASMTVTATGTGLTYQWKKGGSNVSNGGTISGATTATLNISSLIAGDGGNYTVDVAGTCGTSVTSSVSALIINTSPLITVQPTATQTLCTGVGASFSVTATGSGLTYQWKKGGSNISNGGTISGATTSSLAISSLVLADAATYTVDVTGVCGSPITSANSVLNVNTGAAITTQPTATQTLCAGAAASMTVTATGTGLTYQWKKGGSNVSNGGTISGATTSTLNISSLVAGDAGNYTVDVTASGCGSAVTSTTSVLIVNTAAAITVQPTATQTLCAGAAASMTVTATGTGLTYQWKKGGSNISNGGTISGATTSSLAISSLVLADAATYTVDVTGTCGLPVTSSNAVLNVNTGASISTQPILVQTLCVSDLAVFNVTASGTGLTYQWQKNGLDVTNGGGISGATTATLSILSVVASNAGNYTVNVTATGCGTPITSSISQLIVNSPIAITSQPAATQTLCTTNSATFSVTVTGSSLTYQWQKNGANISDGGTISGAATSILTISSLVVGDAGNYTLNITGVCGSPATSNTAVLNVNTGAAITTQPTVTQTLCVGTPASMSVTATGSGLTYQWKKGGSNVTNGGNISGATTATLNISSVAAGDAGNYTVDITASGCGTALTSTTSVLTVNTPISITTQPLATQTLCTGNPASFNVVATGTGLTYQWQLGGVDLTDGGSILGATTATLNISSLVSGDAGTYTVDITGVCGSPVTSSSSVLTVNTGATITTQPTATQTICTTNPASMSVTATGSGLTYQWKKGGSNVTNGGNISGATTATLNISSVAAGDAGNYTVDITASGCGTALTSTTSVLTVNTPISITTQPLATQTLCTGNPASFNVVATGTGLTYQWQLGGVDLTDGGSILGATTATLNISSLVSGDAGTYTVNITGVCGAPVTSSSSVLTVNTGATITTQPTATQTICTTNPVAFSVVASGSGLTYQWKKGGSNVTNGGNISGATTATLNISSVAAVDAGNYTVDITASGCGVPLTSTTAALVVNNSIVITTQPAASQNLCAGSPASFAVVASGTGILYQWQKGGVNITDAGPISGSNTATLTISSVAASDAGNYTVDMTGTCGSTVTSTTAALIISSSVAITLQPVDVNACLGSAANFDLTATGPSLTYQWKKNGVNVVDGGSISGATSSSLVFSPVAATDADTYTCVINSSCGTPVTSNAVTMAVGVGASITKQPISAVVCLGQAATFTIKAPAATSFQWQFKPAAGTYADLPNGSGVSGTTTATLIILGTQFTQRGNYRCVVGGGACSGGVFSAAASLSFQSPSIVSQPLSQSVCAGQLVTFSVVALGNALTYQWVKNGVNVTNGGNTSGAQSATLKIVNAGIADEATYYCEVKGLCPPPTFSDNVDLTLTTCTGIAEAIDGTLFNIYPNPSTGVYHLDMDMYAAGSLTYEVFNTLGESMGADEIKGEGKVVSVIDLSSQVAGVYIVKLTYDDKHSWIRLVLEK